MNKKRNGSIIWLLIFAVIIAIIIFVIYKQTASNSTDEETDYTETEVIKTDIYNTVSNSSYVTTGLEENKPTHATYYLEEIYVEENQKLNEGDYILKYTNGEYLVAPYNCVVTTWNLPNVGEVCTNSHYVTIQSTDTLNISLQVDEDEIDTIYLGQEALIEIDVLEDSEITGYVTSISNTATYSSSGSSFEVTVEFQNDGNILLGMTAECSIVLEKAEDVLAVAKEAVTEEDGKQYVTKLLDSGIQTQIEIETGIENDAYIEVTSGLDEGDLILIDESDDEESNSMNQFTKGGGTDQDNMQFGGGGSEGMQDMPSGGGSGDMTGGPQM